MKLVVNALQTTLDQSASIKRLVHRMDAQQIR